MVIQRRYLYGNLVLLCCHRRHTSTYRKGTVTRRQLTVTKTTTHVFVSVVTGHDREVEERHETTARSHEDDDTFVSVLAPRTTQRALWCGAVALTFYDLCFCACAINVKSSMCSETSKHFRYNCHGLFVNSHVMFTAKSCLKCCSIHTNITFV